MKIGDQKQAITLGVVAVLAIGFLAKTAFGSFSGKMTSKPLQVVDLRGGRKPDEKTPDAPKATAIESPVPTAEKTEEPKAPELDLKPNLAVHDAFANFAMQAKNQGKGFTNPKAGTGNVPHESMRPDSDAGSTLPLGVVDPQGSPYQGPISPGGKENGKTDRNGEQGATTEPKKEQTMLRFDGYVNAGSPMAVLTYKETTITVAVGDVLPDGSKVEKISSDKITLKKGKITTTILVGRESEI